MSARRLRSWPAVALVGAAFAGLLLLGGCSAKKTLVPDLPPETTLFVQGQLDTVNHVVRLHWFGTDADGQVTGYEFRFRNLDPPADTNWVFTTANDSLFTVYSPTGAAAPIFDVRAIDNSGQRDPTPASQKFDFSNQPPSVRFTDAPAPTDETFPAATVSWAVTDADGIAARATYRLWLDGQEANPLIVSATTFTIPPAAFLEGGVYHSHMRTVFVQAIDDGGLAGNIASASWLVRAPVEGGTHGRLLILDDVSTADVVDATLDTLYSNAAARSIPAGLYQTLVLKGTKAFRSQLDLEYALSLFDAVAWTRGTTNPVRNPDFLAKYQDGVGNYVNAGGKLILDGSYLVQNVAPSGALTGALLPSFFTRYLGVSAVPHAVSGRPGEQSYEWGMLNNRPVRSSIFNLAFTCKPSAGVSAYAPSDTSMVALWAPAGTLNPNTGSDNALSVTVPRPGGGRMVIVGSSLFVLDRQGLASAPAFLDAVFAQLGLTGP